MYMCVGIIHYGHFHLIFTICVHAYLNIYPIPFFTSMIGVCPLFSKRSAKKKSTLKNMYYDVVIYLLKIK
jgi:hypothetical protein